MEISVSDDEDRFVDRNYDAQTRKPIFQLAV